MKKTDLITGMLGAGKTTFITTYARHMAEKCGPVCLIANDYGAISVDRALLEEKIGDLCDIEMVVAGDPDCQRRRFRTKLISMGMLGYERVIVEPSGVFDTEEFYNILYDDPISSWYEIGNVISIVPADIPEELPESSEYLLADQAALNKVIVRRKLVPRKYNEQGERPRPDTVLHHFSNNFKFWPYFRVQKVKPFEIDKVHEVLKITEYDDILKEYDKLKHNVED